MLKNKKQWNATSRLSVQIGKARHKHSPLALPKMKREEHKGVPLLTPSKKVNSQALKPPGLLFAPRTNYVNVKEIRWAHRWLLCDEVTNVLTALSSLTAQTRKTSRSLPFRYCCFKRLPSSFTQTCQSSQMQHNSCPALENSIRNHLYKKVLMHKTGRLFKKMSLYSKTVSQCPC